MQTSGGDLLTASHSPETRSTPNTLAPSARRDPNELATDFEQETKQHFKQGCMILMEWQLCCNVMKTVNVTVTPVKYNIAQTTRLYAKAWIKTAEHCHHVVSCDDAHEVVFDEGRAEPVMMGSRPSDDGLSAKVLRQ
jgi:hypothetical protein